MKVQSPHDVSSLVETIARFENADEPDVISRWVSWPELARFFHSSLELKTARERFARNVEVEADNRRWSKARHLLRSSFVSPSHPLLEIADESTWGALADGELGDVQESVRNTARQLVAGPHRCLDAMGQFFGESPRISWPATGTARVIVPSSAVAGTLEALQSLGASDVEWHVCSLTEARRSASCAVTVMPGAPELHEGWRTDEELRPRIVGWVFNAPMSRHVVSIRWPGSRPFESDKYEPHHADSVFDARNWSDGGDDQFVLDEETAPEPSSPRPAASTQDANEAIPAIDFRLPDRYWISFGLEDGPKASRIDDDSEFDTEVETGVAATQLRRGNILVILSSEQARSLRNELCGDWLARDTARPSFDVAWRTVSSYKSAVRRLLATVEGVEHLRRKGFPEQYIRSQYIRSTPSSVAMAPQRESTFTVFATAASWVPPPHAWAHVEALRAGFQYAGREIAQRLRSAVTEDVSWLELVDRQQIAHVEVTGLGGVTLAPILAANYDPVMRGENELGVLVRT